MHKTDLPNFLTSSALTDVGLCREENQDNYLIYNGEFSFFTVADGMGGVGGGATASKMAVTLLEEKLKAFVKLNPLALVSSLVEINSAIYEIGQKDEQLTGMGTTLCALAFQGHELLVLNIGDSRSYRIRSGNISQLTRDHTLANELYQSGSITNDKIDNHPSSHMLTRSLGPLDTIDPDCWWHRTSLMPKDKFLICSDGLYNMISDKEAVEILEANKNLDTACKKLVDLANERGGNDNITVVVIEVSSKYKPLSVEKDQNNLNDTIKVKREQIDHIASNKKLKATILVLLLLISFLTAFYIYQNLEHKKDFNKVLAIKINKEEAVDDFFKNIEEEKEESNIIGNSEIPRVQNFIQRMNEIEFLILRYQRILDLFNGVKSGSINEKLIQSRIDELKTELQLSQKNLGQVKIAIEKEAGNLAKWYSYKNQNNNNLFIKLGRELALKNDSIKKSKDKFEDSSWQYFNKLEKLRNSQNESEVKKLKSLVTKREVALEELIKKIKVTMEVEIQSLNQKISKHTVQKYEIQQKEKFMLQEFKDLKLAKNSGSEKFNTRYEEIKAKILELEKEKEALGKYLN